MERLTAKYIVAGVEIFDLKVGIYEEKAFNLLGQYEDTGLTPADVAELVQAKKDGLLVMFPCDMVYIIHDAEVEYGGKATIEECIVSEVSTYRFWIENNSKWFKHSDIGKTVFLTKAEAQAALGRMEGQK